MEVLKGMMMSSLLAFVVALVVTLVFGPVFIPWLRKLKFGQEIREEGPKWHQKKSGTPTMGGIMFIVGIAAAILVTTIIFAVNGNLDKKELIILHLLQQLLIVIHRNTIITRIILLTQVTINIIILTLTKNQQNIVFIK